MSSENFFQKRFGNVGFLLYLCVMEKFLAKIFFGAAILFVILLMLGFLVSPILLALLYLSAPLSYWVVGVYVVGFISYMIGDHMTSDFF